MGPNLVTTLDHHTDTFFNVIWQDIKFVAFPKINTEELLCMRMHNIRINAYICGYSLIKLNK